MYETSHQSVWNTQEAPIEGRNLTQNSNRSIASILHYTSQSKEEFFLKQLNLKSLKWVNAKRGNSVCGYEHLMGLCPSELLPSHSLGQHILSVTALYQIILMKLTAAKTESYAQTFQNKAPWNQNVSENIYLTYLTVMQHTHTHAHTEIAYFVIFSGGRRLISLISTPVVVRGCWLLSLLFFWDIKFSLMRPRHSWMAVWKRWFVSGLLFHCLRVHFLLSLCLMSMWKHLFMSAWLLFGLIWYFLLCLLLQTNFGVQLVCIWINTFSDLDFYLGFLSLRTSMMNFVWL